MNAFSKMRSIALVPACLALALVSAAVSPAVTVNAASGTVYSCDITRCYQHPVTGEIEDSGGSSSYTTGQGMVEGVIADTGLLEVTDSGEYYLNFQCSLLDYTSDQEFTVQTVGASGWSTAEMEVTSYGEDSNGTNCNICIEVPSESCIIRASMYVEPMGRDVIFYFYPDNYVEGNTTGFTATVVTEASTGSSSDDASVDEESSDTVTGSLTASDNEENEDEDEEESTTSSTLVSSISEAASDDTDSSSSSSDSTLSSSQGLSLSTEDEVDVDETAETTLDISGAITSFSVGLALAITVSGLILICTAAVIVYYFRKNWRRWGGGYDDDDDED